MSAALRRALPVILAAGLACAATQSSAATRASVRPSFLPDRLGAMTSLTFSARFSSGEAGLPAPLRSMTVHLPAGLGVSLRAVATCPPGRLRRGGAAACPSRALVGRGQATLAVHAGSQTISEHASMWAFRAPDQGGHHALEILGVGLTPLMERTISRAVLLPDRPPYGLRLVVSIPPIPTMPLEPDASFRSFSLTVGTLPPIPKAHAAAGAITVPRRCPAGGFPFAADFTFADGSTSSNVTSVRCP